MEILIKDVFNSYTATRETYISQDSGFYELELKQSILEEGTLCLLTGSSKTGKTSLYKKVLAELDKVPIKIRCNDSLKPDEFWSRPLEELDFSRLKSIEDGATTTIGGSVAGSGALGWEWLGKITATLTASASRASAEKEVKEAILAKPSPSHLVPLLQKSNAVLVVEDFHYLHKDTQREIFQQWKVFTDEGVSVIVVGTTHHGVDLANANPDLVGRISHIELGRWSDSDLQAIAQRGLKKLNVIGPSAISSLVAKESAGLPIIVQQACAQLFKDRGLISWDVGQPINFTSVEAKKALHNVAKRKYSSFESWYEKLVNGPRKGARKYDTYRVILALFTQDPPIFNMQRAELDRRLGLSGIASAEYPPKASITSTLSALDTFQKSSGFELLEWSKSDKTVYILVPSFLFYLRWKEDRSAVATLGDVFIVLLEFSKFFKK
ncbi:AAA family ATPase [Pseudomonas syringae]|uniref:AAA family ATPase n=1 Tax=Pseudomonas syringae TaxID=317 RepID=UPI0002A79772|nr:AAA family ATPase [Pseudomonas syringae]ELQ00585.1 hypothetical protein A979_12040 [Pseudomonas syringae BRIP34876]ELQ06847.1 hypothetical protein A987_01141 [Pseudomonas syringae BRIP34881]